MTRIFRVLGQTEMMTLEKADATPLQKCSIELQEIGGQFEDKFLAVMLGTMATLRFEVGQLVVAKLRFNTHMYGDQRYQDITVNDIVRL